MIKVKFYRRLLMAVKINYLVTKFKFRVVAHKITLQSVNRHNDVGNDTLACEALSILKALVF